VGIPRALAGEIVTILVADRDVRVLTMDGDLLRYFELDPSRDYQPMSLDANSRSAEFDRRRKANQS
jgi:hypothetical protein